MDAGNQTAARERKTRVLNFRIPPSVEAQLSSCIDPGIGAKSVDRAARKILLEALAEREQSYRLSALNVENLRQFEFFTGDAGRILKRLRSKFCRTCVTSPAYWHQRDYGHPEQIGRERTPDRYISRLVDVFDEVHRVLTDDGTLWVVIDDSYWKKQLVGVPWRLAFELQRRGWLWRSEIVWAKASTPEPCKDRPTRAHEAVLLFSKRRAGYFYNYEAIMEPHDNPWAIDCIKKAQEKGLSGRPHNDPFWSKEERRRRGARGITRAEYGALMNPNGKNKRDVWQIPNEKFKGLHSAVMPIRLAETCVLAASMPGDVVLDPFCGVATTGVAALKHERKFIGIDLVPRFIGIAIERLNEVVRIRPTAEAPIRS